MMLAKPWPMKSVAEALLVAALGFAVSGCGGIADEVVAGAGQNTPLSITVPDSVSSITVGSERAFGVTVADIDGIDSVKVTLDGAPVAVSVVGSTYSIILPATLTVGAHQVGVTATGKAPDGTLEVPRSANIAFTVLVKNTPAVAGPVTGSTHFTVGTATTLGTTVIDPNGIASVSATLDGAPLAVTQLGSAFSVVLPASLSAGTHSLIFSAAGLNPDGTAEAVQTVTQIITVYPPNTPLVIGSVVGPTSYTVGTPQTYRAVISDPDSVASVTASLDGVSIPVTAGTSDYSVAVPASLAVGSHTLVFTATGRLPDGQLEAPQTVSVGIRVFARNTPAVIGAIAGLANYTVGTSSILNTTVVDPDGISGVTASLDGTSIAVTQNGSVYAVVLTASVPIGTHTLAFTVAGLNPDGSVEVPQTVTQTVTVYPLNTPLVIGSVVGANSYIEGTAQSYSVTVIDPDSVAAVTATLDGVAIPVSAIAPDYSVTLPASLAVGSHVLVFSGTGRLPDGSLEAPHTVTQTITVLQANTVLAISPITVSPVLILTNVATSTVYQVTVVDPQGILSVTASLTTPWPNTNPPTAAVTAPTTNVGSTYSINVFNTRQCGRLLEFTAIGLNPDGTAEAPQVTSLIIC